MDKGLIFFYIYYLLGIVKKFNSMVTFIWLGSLINLLVAGACHLLYSVYVKHKKYLHASEDQRYILILIEG